MLENVYEGLNAQKCKGRSNQKIQKTKSIYFRILLLEGPSRYLSIGHANTEMQKAASVASALVLFFPLSVLIFGLYTRKTG